jgi:hypothetical protein
MFPRVQFTLCDSLARKTLVVQEIAKAVGLTNVTVVTGRVESLHQKFDFCITRAVAVLEKLWGWSSAKYRRGVTYAMTDDVIRSSGLIALKGGDLTEEFAESKLKVTAWPIEAVFKDEPWFKGKYVVHVAADDSRLGERKEGKAGQAKPSGWQLRGEGGKKKSRKPGATKSQTPEFSISEIEKIVGREPKKQRSK